jgi:hypothetical protein
MDTRVVMPIVSLSASAGYLAVLAIFGYCGYSMYQLMVKTEQAIAESQVVVFQYENGIAPTEVDDPFTEPATSSVPSDDPYYDEPSLVQPCYIGGCSGQICSNQPNVVSTCEWRPEYACYQHGKCERQLTGQCGWTNTVDLLRCLKDARSEQQVS